MASTLSPEDKALFEEWLAKAEPYPDDDPAINTWDGAYEPARMRATIAKRALDGRLK